MRYPPQSVIRYVPSHLGGMKPSATLDYISPPTRPRQNRPAAIALAWLCPASLHLIAWVLLFRPYPTDGPGVYVRNVARSVAGVPLFFAAQLGHAFVSLPAAVAAASVCLVGPPVLLVGVGRRLPLGIYVGLSCVWNLAGCALYAVLCA